MNASNTRWILVAYFLNGFAMSLVAQFYSYFINTGLGEVSLTVNALAGSLPPFVGLFTVGMWGKWSDKIGKRKPFLIIGFMGSATSYLLLSMVDNVYLFIFIAAAAMAFTVAGDPSAVALVTHGVEEKGKAIGNYMFARALGWTGALVSGLYLTYVVPIEDGGMHNLFFFSFISMCIAILVIIFKVEDVKGISNKTESIVKFTDVLKIRPILLLFLSVLFMMSAVQMIGYLMPVWMITELGGIPIYVGMGNSVAAISGAFLMPIIGRLGDRYGGKKIYLAAPFLYGTIYLVLANVHDPLVASIIWMSPVFPTYMAGSSLLAAQLTTDRQRARAMSAVSMAQGIGTSIGPVIGGFLVDNYLGLISRLFYMASAVAYLGLVIGSFIKCKKKERSAEAQLQL